MERYMSKFDSQLNEALEHGTYMRDAGHKQGYLDALYELSKEIGEHEYTTISQVLGAITNNIGKKYKGENDE